MFQGKHCFSWPESIDAVIQYARKQDIVEKLTVLVVGVYFFYRQMSSCGLGPRFIWPMNAFLFRGVRQGQRTGSVLIDITGAETVSITTLNF